jgi:hypothetical protein
MNKKKPLEGLDSLIAWTLKEKNIYLEATKDNQIKVHLSNDNPPNSVLACSIKEFVENDWSLMRKIYESNT